MKKKKLYLRPHISRLQVFEDTSIMTGSDETDTSLQPLENGGELAKPNSMWEEMSNE